MHAWREGVFRLLGDCLGQTLEVEQATCSKEEISFERVKVLLGKVLKLPTHILLLVEDLQISILVEADREPERDLLVRSPVRSIGASVPGDGDSRHVLEDEDDDVSPLNTDVSPRFSNFKSSTTDRDSSSRQRGRGGSSCDSGFGSTSSFDSEGLDFILEPGSGSQTSRPKDPVVGPVFDPFGYKLAGPDLNPRLTYRDLLVVALPEDGARARLRISFWSDVHTTSSSPLPATAMTLLAINCPARHSADKGGMSPGRAAISPAKAGSPPVVARSSPAGTRPKFGKAVQSPSGLSPAIVASSSEVGSQPLDFSTDVDAEKMTPVLCTFSSAKEIWAIQASLSSAVHRPVLSHSREPSPSTKSIEDRHNAYGHRSSTPQKCRPTLGGLWDLSGAPPRELCPSPHLLPEQGWVFVVKSKEFQLLKRSYFGECHVPKGLA